jgi:uncharacterized membrane protein
MLFFMGAASHLTLFPHVTKTAKYSMLVVLLVLMAIAEINAMVGTTGPGKKMLSTLKGTFWGGFVLTAILYCAIELLFP